MKKFVIALIMALMSLSAHGQLVENGKSVVFMLGDYKFMPKGIIHTKEWCSKHNECYGGTFTLSHKDSHISWDEEDEVVSFINSHRKELEKKYNVVIEHSYRSTFFIYDKETYDKANAETEKALKEIDNQKRSRLNSLNNIL